MFLALTIWRGESGVLTVPHAWRGQYNVNQITSYDDIDVITGMPRFSNLPVQLAKA
jgi:hypothetical protein